MRSRAVLLPTPCDPFLLKYWIDNFKKYYKNEVDKLYVHINSSVEKSVIEYIQEMLDEVGASYIYKNIQVQHGDCLNELLEMCTEEYVMLVEDDSYVFEKGNINECFEMVESGKVDCVVGKRGSCAIEILERASDLWGIDYNGEGDQGCNFWPNMFFSKRETLLKTDRNFCAKQWNAGDYIPALDYTMKETGCGDTFVNTSLQLRAMNLRFHYENQYHASPFDIKDYEEKKNLWDGKASWVHIGSLSSGLSGMLVDDNQVPLVDRLTGKPRPIELPASIPDEWARRIQMWQTFYDNSNPEKIPEFREEYRKAVDRLYRICGVNPKTVKRRQAMYKELGL